MVAKKPAACRAEIPPMLSQEQRDAVLYTPQYIEEFLTEFSWLKEKELALQCLFDGEFDVPKAVGLLHTARRESYKARRDQDKRLPFKVLKKAIATHGKKFHLVKVRAAIIRKVYIVQS
ncbi:uncharacterized protein PITG_19145 [Phytophthora infestans T30-4]|uniref:Uncharacterized protein n=1 Tax=Phytophthora infestans (strain T30-4) TaxID=403677 RepID=D0NYY1_PHYIT|nr:uncharacterized protein PITG_19145 [Phytophthora infestans T30-4]EEY68764.1 conserved hypothetical protein [Phytophthora infestans T30-4]|eukprot:XP_002997456.1 conserved hypothetical protein [Phytophthora infestans T30-4]